MDLTGNLIRRAMIVYYNLEDDLLDDSHGNVSALQDNGTGNESSQQNVPLPWPKSNAYSETWDIVTVPKPLTKVSKPWPNVTKPWPNVTKPWPNVPKPWPKVPKPWTKENPKPGPTKPLPVIVPKPRPPSTETKRDDEIQMLAIVNNSRSESKKRHQDYSRNPDRQKDTVVVPKPTLGYSAVRPRVPVLQTKLPDSKPWTSKTPTGPSKNPPLQTAIPRPSENNAGTPKASILLTRTLVSNPSTVIISINSARSPDLQASSMITKQSNIKTPAKQQVPPVMKSNMSAGSPKICVKLSSLQISVSKPKDDPGVFSTPKPHSKATISSVVITSSTTPPKTCILSNATHSSTLTSSTSSPRACILQTSPRLCILQSKSPVTKPRMYNLSACRTQNSEQQNKQLASSSNTSSHSSANQVKILASMPSTSKGSLESKSWTSKDNMEKPRIPALHAKDGISKPWTSTNCTKSARTLTTQTKAIVSRPRTRSISTPVSYIVSKHKDQSSAGLQKTFVNNVSTSRIESYTYPPKVAAQSTKTQMANPRISGNICTSKCQIQCPRAETETVADSSMHIPSERNYAVRTELPPPDVTLLQGHSSSSEGMTQPPQEAIASPKRQRNEPPPRKKQSRKQKIVFLEHSCAEEIGSGQQKLPFTEQKPRKSIKPLGRQTCTSSTRDIPVVDLD